MEDKKIMANAHRYFKIGIIICILALIFSPFLPWLGCTDERSKEDSEDKETVTKFTSEANIHIYAEYASGDTGDAIEDLSDNIGMVTTFLWLTLIFLILGYLGVIFYKVGRRFEMVGKILALIGCFAFIFAILCLVFNGLCFINVMDLQEATEDNYDDMDDEDVPQYFLGYNYVPLIASLLLMFIGSLLMIRVFQPGISSIRNYYYSYPPQPYQSGPYGRAPPPPPPEDEGYGCPNCGATVSAGMAYCPYCGTSAPPSPPPPPPPSPQRREPMRRMTVFKCPLCEAVIMEPNICPYCGWSK